jgi:hypothetical protein
MNSQRTLLDLRIARIQHASSCCCHGIQKMFFSLHPETFGYELLDLDSWDRVASKLAVQFLHPEVCYILVFSSSGCSLVLLTPGMSIPAE